MDTTPVTFRVCNGEIIAILPSLIANNGRFVMYAHLGQHGEIATYYTMFTKLATQDQYNDLLQELISLGYENIKVYKRISYELLWWNLR